jgi:hypothetical protein
VTPPEETGGNREYKLRPKSQRPNPTRPEPIRWESSGMLIGGGLVSFVIRLRKMDSISYPLIDLGDGFPAATSSIELYESPDQMGLCNHLAIMGGCFSGNRRFYDREGHVFQITRVTPEPRISGFQRFLAHVCYNPIKKFQVELGQAGEADLDQMKARIRELLESDPGDLLYQWTDHEEWEAGLAASKAVPDLFDFITKRALVDHDNYSNEEGEQDGAAS